MPYTTKDILKGKAGILARVPDAILDIAISEAEKQINGRLSGLLPVPYQGAAPLALQVICGNLACAYALVSDHALGAEDRPVDLADFFLRLADKDLDRLAPSSGGIVSDIPAELPPSPFYSSASGDGNGPILRDFNLRDLPCPPRGRRPRGWPL